jgi:LuxR family transcriptional regulator, maltose regulon positive regulatory protein
MKRSSGAPHLAVGLPFELLESKLVAPQVGARGVPRTALMARLDEAPRAPLVVVNAGAGYGKTTMLVQWGKSLRQRRLAWVSALAEDNDPVVLLAYVATALDRVTPIDSDVFEALASPGASVRERILPRLGHALSQIEAPVALVIDDAHLIENPRCHEAIVTLAGHLSGDSRLVLSTRDQSTFPLGRLRTSGLLLELDAEDLRMGNEEARALLAAEQIEAPDDEIDELVGRTEGWPAGLYLAALAARASEPGRTSTASLTGKHRFLVEFLQSEFMNYLPPEQLAFLSRTSMLELLSGPLCDAVLESDSSAATLASLEHSNRFVVALDRDGGWYRCHHLVREALLAALVESQPDEAALLLARAADWCAANGQAVAAIRYAREAGDVERVASTMERAMLPVFQSGRIATVDEWLGWLEANAELDAHAGVAVVGAMFHAVVGRPAKAERWAVAAERGERPGELPDGSGSIESWRALMRAARSQDGAGAMKSDAEAAVSTLADDSMWHPMAVVTLGMAEALAGAPETAEDCFADAAEEARQLAAPDMLPLALGERALMALQQGEWARADGYAEHAVWAAHRSRLEDSAHNVVVFAVAARTAFRGGRTAAARDFVAHAERLTPQLTHALPVPAVQARLTLARAHLEMADPASARGALKEIDAILRRCPDLGVLGTEADEIRLSLSSAGRATEDASPLTDAELRVLPMLPTHLSFRDIGVQLYLSRHTVKSHSMSIYRKLGVGSRGDAVERAREIGLI